MPDAVGVPDVPQPRPGLYVMWSANPGLPGVLTDKITVEEVTFEVEHLEVVGDSPGGTTRSRYRLTWSDEARPAQEEFLGAPPGLYSQVGIRFNDASRTAYEIHGTWHDERDGKDLRFEISDRGPLFITLDCATTLPAAGSATIEIELQLQDAFSAIAFEDVGRDDDELQLTDLDLEQFRMRLPRAFKIK